MALPRAGVEMVAENMAPFLRDMGKANDAVSDFGKQGSKSGGLFDKGFSQVVIGGLREVGAGLVDFAAEGTKALAGFFKDSVKQAGDFEQGLKEFKVAAGKALDTKGLEQFHDLFISLGKELPVSTSEVEQAAIEMVKGGLDPAILAAGGLKSNIQFAAAAMKGDLVGAAEISSKVVAGWAGVNATATEKADLLTHATDLLTKAANASSTDVHQLSLGLFNVQGIAKTAGASLDDVTTVLAELAPDFASTAEAGNSLKNFLARLQPTTAPAAGAMEALGLWTKAAGSAFYDAQGNFVGFQKASQLLQDSLKDLTKEQQANLLQTIFGNDAMNAAAGLAARGADGYKNMADQLTNAMGVTEAAATQQDSYNTALANAKGSVEALQISLGEKLLPVLTDLLNNYIAPGVNSISKFAETMFKLGPAIAASSDPLQSFLNALKVAAPDLLPFISKIEQIKDTFVAVVTYLNQNVIPVFGKVYDWLQVTLPMAAQTISNFWTDTLQPALAKVNDYLQSTVFPTFKDLAGKILPDATKSTDDMADSWTRHLYPSLQLNGNFLKDTLIPYWGSFFNFLGAIASKILEAHAGWWEFLWEKLSKVGETIVKTVTPAFNMTLGPAIQWVAGLFKGLGGGIDGVSLSLKGVTDWLNTTAEKIRNLKLPAWLTPGSPTPWEVGLLGIADALQDAVVPGVHAFEGALSRIGAVIEGSDLPELAVAWGQDVMEGFAQGIKQATSTVVTYIDNAGQTIEDAFKDGFKIGSPSKLMADEVGFPLMQGILEGLQAAWPQLLAGLGELSDDLVDQAKQAAEQIQDAVASAFGATADINRQKAKNLGDLQKLQGATRQQAESQLKTAEELASTMADPEQAKAFYALRSKQIFELAKLQDEVSKTTDKDQQARLAEQLALIQKAQQLEQQGLAAKTAGQSGSDKLIEALRALLQGGFPVNDTGVGADLMALLAQLEGYKPPAGPGQQSVGGATYNTSYNYSMPVTTNMTPGAIQQSWAIMGAAMP